MVNEHCFIVKTFQDKILNCFTPQSILDINNDPYFPLYNNFEIDRKNNDLFYLNAFNEFQRIKLKDTTKQKYYYSTSIQNREHTILKLATNLPVIIVKSGLKYNNSFNFFIMNNNYLNYCYPLIDSIYNYHTGTQYKLTLDVSNDYFFDKYDPTDKDRKYLQRFGFFINTLSRNSKNNLTIVTKTFKNYENDLGKLENFLVQEYDGNNYNLIKSVKIPYQYKEVNGKKTNVVLIKSNPFEPNTFVIIYKDDEKYYVDFCKW